MELPKLKKAVVTLKKLNIPYEVSSVMSVDEKSKQNSDILTNEKTHLTNLASMEKSGRNSSSDDEDLEQKIQAFSIPSRKEWQDQKEIPTNSITGTHSPKGDEEAASEKNCELLTESTAKSFMESNNVNEKQKDNIKLKKCVAKVNKKHRFSNSTLSPAREGVIRTISSDMKITKSSIQTKDSEKVSKKNSEKNRTRKEKHDFLGSSEEIETEEKNIQKRKAQCDDKLSKRSKNSSAITQILGKSLTVMPENKTTHGSSLLSDKSSQFKCTNKKNMFLKKGTKKIKDIKPVSVLKRELNIDTSGQGIAKVPERKKKAYSGSKNRSKTIQGVSLMSKAIKLRKAKRKQRENVIFRLQKVAKNLEGSQTDDIEFCGSQGLSRLKEENKNILAQISSKAIQGCRSTDVFDDEEIDDEDLLDKICNILEDHRRMTSYVEESSTWKIHHTHETNSKNYLLTQLPSLFKLRNLQIHAKFPSEGKGTLFFQKLWKWSHHVKMPSELWSLNKHPQGNFVIMFRISESSPFPKVTVDECVIFKETASPCVKIYGKDVAALSSQHELQTLGDVRSFLNHIHKLALCKGKCFSEEKVGIDNCELYTEAEVTLPFICKYCM